MEPTRPPRYRFPDGVRSTTRDIAARMIAAGAVAGTPEELERWIADAPEARASLEAGGYGTAFTADDLHPLLEAMAAHAGWTPPRADAPAPTAAGGSRWLWAALLLALFVLVLFFVLAGGGRSAP